MISATGGDVHAPPAHTFDNGGIGNIDFQHIVERYAGFLHRVGLRDGAGETVEQIAIGTVWLL